MTGQLSCPADRSPPVRPSGGLLRTGLRRRALLVGPAVRLSLSGPLSARVAECVCVDEPYSAMTMLLDDPQDWLLCIIDALAFAGPTSAEGFLRLLRFEQPPVPLILANAAAESGPGLFADSAVGDPSDAESIAAVLACADRRLC